MKSHIELFRWYLLFKWGYAVQSLLLWLGRSYQHEAHRFPDHRQDPCIFPPNLRAHRTLDGCLNNLMKEQGHQQVPLTSIYISCFISFLSLTTYNTLFCKHILVPPKRFQLLLFAPSFAWRCLFWTLFQYGRFNLYKDLIFILELKKNNYNRKEEGPALKLNPIVPPSSLFILWKDQTCLSYFRCQHTRQNMVEFHKRRTSKNHHSTSHSFNLLCLKNLESQYDNKANLSSRNCTSFIHLHNAWGLYEVT